VANRIPVIGGTAVMTPTKLLKATYLPPMLRFAPMPEETNFRALSRSWNGWAVNFDGVMVFDESHAMQNAAGGTGARGDVSLSQACGCNTACR
jgi:hypothetical protein